MGCPGCLWGPLGAVLGRSWGRLGPFWEPLGRPLGRLGAVLAEKGPSWGSLGASWAVLGAILGRPGGLLGPLGAVLGPSWAVLGLSSAIAFVFYLFWSLRRICFRPNGCLLERFYMRHMPDNLARRNARERLNNVVPWERPHRRQCRRPTWSKQQPQGPCKSERARQ